jgi:SatD family (SatD)
MFFFFINNPYIAIIGDIKKSRELKDRDHVQEQLKETLSIINEKYENDISAKFLITLGDEFQGLLHTGHHIIKIIEEIQRSINPVKVRFGIGVGEIVTDINPNMALGADGPGYYKARQAIDFLKLSEQKRKSHASDIRIEVDGENETTVILLNTILSLLSVIKGNWSERQREIIWDALIHQDGQKKSAERLHVAQSSIQRGLINGNYYAYKEAIDTVNRILAEIGEEHV